MKKLIGASLIAALSLTMLAGGASAAPNTTAVPAKTNVQDVTTPSSEVKEPVYVTVPVGWYGPLTEPKFTLSFHRASDDQHVVDVDSFGYLTALKPGKAVYYSEESLLGKTVIQYYYITVTE